MTQIFSPKNIDIIEDMNLCEADLSDLDLSGVRLDGANLTGAKLRGTDLTGSILNGAILNGAFLFRAKLAKTQFISADLIGAAIMNSDVTDANFQDANLEGAYLDFAPGSVPNIPQMATASGLAGLKFTKSPHSLVDLRDGFKKAGNRDAERELTYAIRRGETERANVIERLFNIILFDLTSKYGMYPGRPVRLLFIGIALFTLPYAAALRIRKYRCSRIERKRMRPYFRRWLIYLTRRRRRGGIWKIWDADRLLDRAQPGASERRNHRAGTAARVQRPARSSRKASLAPKLTDEKSRLFLSGFQALRYGFYFSILSAFHFGWRDINVGSWIVRIQPSEFTLKASDWVRTLSGVQSLISVYLLALWALTYFGRPFE
jgi:hypothetical protein